MTSVREWADHFAYLAGVRYFRCLFAKIRRNPSKNRIAFAAAAELRFLLEQLHKHQHCCVADLKKTCAPALDLRSRGSNPILTGLWIIEKDMDNLLNLTISI
jgi:hypothetical protein